MHISARLAWHDDGWNGCICRNPAANTFCVGEYSYPGQHIAENRDLNWEKQCAGKHCGSLDRIPPCCYSINAFGAEEVQAEAEPPSWFKDGTSTRRWPVPPATVCVWPYEEMYADDVRVGNRFDYDRRLERARTYFDSIKPDRSLVFYYANYSNPFSEDEMKRYVLVGLSRVQSVGDELFYEGCSQRVRERYGGGFVWQRNITSHYPNQGFRIPYHKYRNQPEVLEQIALFPDNPRVCKYATRLLSDDDALGLVESFLRVVENLRDIGDTTEDWRSRTAWLQGLIAELWRHRGLLPGMGAVLEAIGFPAAIPYFKKQALDGREVEAHDAIFGFLEGRVSTVPGLDLKPDEAKGALRKWKVRTPAEQHLLRDVLPRFDLESAQICSILSENREENGITADLDAIANNPYILCEQYLGNDPDDIIPWGTIDRGMIPSPDLGCDSRAAVDDPRRLRALLVDALKRQSAHCFAAADQLIESVNRRLSALPEWKRCAFRERHLEVDADVMHGALHIRREGDRTYLYLRTVYEDERRLEEDLRFLLGGPDIQPQFPVTRQSWRDYLYDPQSVLAGLAEQDYREAIERQAEACEKIFRKPLGVLCGEAGTGKTTVVRAIVKAIKKGHGAGASVIALAPTGKATDRIREVLEADDALRGKVEVATIHSFLARHGWLNPNMSFKRQGGQIEDQYSTYILDECSMLDLSLAAAFFRSVRWSSVQRLILVGDPNQLPPIGRGRVFGDIIKYLEKDYPENVAVLTENLRQAQGRLTGGGTGIIDLAKCYLRTALRDAKNEDASTAAEIMLQRVQEGGDIDHDLRVLYWSSQAELNDLLISQIEQDMRTDLERRPPRGKSKPVEDEDKPWVLWSQAFDRRPDYLQIITPYRGEFFGTEEINRICQERLRKSLLSKVGAIDGITLFDKVIQVVNRPRSRPIKACYKCGKGKPEPIEVFNGQIGFVVRHPLDRDKELSRSLRLERFCVVFARREGLLVGYGRNLGDGCPDESVGENLELAYALSVHKAQGSDFDRVYLVVPASKQGLLSPELLYTALTRARKHCTLLVERDVSMLLKMRRREYSHLERINSSLFAFRPVPDGLMAAQEWRGREDGRGHGTLADVMVRSKSEVIIANMLHERGIPFRYEEPLYGPDGSFYLPDFTITWRGSDYYWEHVGLLSRPEYRAHWEKKRAWYDRFFPGRLIITEESGDLSREADAIIRKYFI